MGESRGESRRALITGTAAGLGRAIAAGLAREGYDLALTEHDTAMMKDTLADPAIADRKAVAVALDLRSQASITAAFDRATRELGDIDLLVNNAGRALLKPVVDVTDAEWDDVIDTNLKGAFFLSQLFGRHCIAQRRPGAIVSIASTHGMTGIAGRSVYGISKAGLIQMTRMLAIEWVSRKPERGLRHRPHAHGRRRAYGVLKTHRRRFPIPRNGDSESSNHAAADFPIAALTRGMTCSAISCIERLPSAGSAQSMPA
jgi:NAD(P)-dependent dehydrogenase (short-subunit alcohol dehydrogenase family)